MIPTPAVRKPPKIQKISTRSWEKGTVTAFDDGRTPIEGLRASGNVMIDQDGTIRPRPSLLRYGTQFTGTVLGDMYEFVRTESGVPTNYLITLQNVSGITEVYVCKDGGSWTRCAGKTYNNTARGHFVQVENKVLVTNGEDNLSYLDMDTLTVIPFTALTTPAAPTLTKTGHTTANYTYFYKVTANSTVGETAASVATSVGVTSLRSAWDGSNFVTVSWAAVTNAQSYNLYVGTSQDNCQRIVVGITGTTYKDSGSAQSSVLSVAPLGDTTAGPKATRSALINDQVFLVGDKDNPRYVRYGGTGQNLLDFSPFNGGGWSEVGRGKEFPTQVTPPPANAESYQALVLCRGTNGKGKRYTMTPLTITEGDVIISDFKIEEDNGEDGTDSPDGVVLVNNDLYYPSKNGFKKTGTKPQLQTFLSTDRIDETIIEDTSSLSSEHMDKCVGLAYDQRIYWALPVGSTENNEIWVLDLQRGGAWMKPWNIAASSMVLYNDNSGQTHHLINSNNVLYELTNSQATLDDGAAFRTNATSGFIKFSEDGMEWAKVIDVTFIILRPQGTINFTVSGKTEESSLQSVGNESFTSSSNSSPAGWSEAGWGGSPDSEMPTIYGWSDWSEVPLSYGDASRPITIEVDEELQWIAWELNTSTAGVSYQLSDVVIRYVPIGFKDLD